jgi:mono/diheme cytochrome c family protein
LVQHRSSFFGGLAYGQNCAVCHGAQLEGGAALKQTQAPSAVEM